jgi:Tol biopolymer transport system component
VSGSARGEAQRISDDAASKHDFSIARDGSRLAYSAVFGSRGQRRTEVRIRDLASGRETVPISSTGGLRSLNPRLSPDGSFMSWIDNVAGGQASFVAATGETMGREACRGCRILGFFSNGAHVLVRSGPTRLVKQDLGDDSQHTLVELNAGAIMDADISWDDQWLALATGGPEGTASIHVLPLGKSPTPVRDWILVAESARWVGSPRWSPDGRFLYYHADRDDFTCIWAQPLDATTKTPSGEPFAVVHAHRSTLKIFGPRYVFSLAVSHGMLIFNAAELTGDIFVTELEPG